MKKCIFIFFFMITSLTGSAQALHIFHDGLSTPDVVANGGIDSIYFAPKFFGSSEYQQVFVTADGVKRYDVVDSVKFNLPYFVAFRHNIYIPSDYKKYPGIFHIKVCWSADPDHWLDEIGLDVISLESSDGTSIPCSEGSGWYGSSSIGKKIRIYPENIDFSSGDSITCYILGTILGTGVKDSITIINSSFPVVNNPIKDICFSNEEQDYVIDTDIPNSRVIIKNPEHGYAYLNKEGKPVIHLYKNDSGENKDIYMELCIGGGFTINSEGYRIDQLGVPFKHTKEEHMSALRDFCDSTDYDSWGNNTNWWTEAPLWEWGGFNEEKMCLYGKINSGHHPQYIRSSINYQYLINDHVVSLNFNGGEYNGVHGKLPASFEVFIDDIQGDLDLRGCALSGEIPYNIRHNPNWSKYGWNIIQQEPWFGGGFDMDDINLRMKDEEIMYADGSKGTAYEELAKHKLTFVSVGAPNEAMCNLCLAYASKGFQYIYAAQDWLGGTLEEAQESSYEFSDVPNVTVCYKSWSNGDLGDGLGAIGSTFLLDSEGNVIDYAMMDWDLGEELYTNRLGKLLLKHLGEPEEHEPYVPKEKVYYTSSDYSHDGEVLTLQKATIGKGVDLVFIGDQYVDTLLVAGGQYEKDMQAAMEYFFEAEPYKTLRDRFNVYIVKAVSQNGHEGPVHKFNYDNELVFDYVRKIPNVDMDHVAVAVIYNASDAFFSSGETAMWESGSSIAYIDAGGPSNIICHEMGGHGIAKLLDEYVYAGYENNHTQEGANESFQEWIKTAYHDKGWGMNISATDNPDEVPWAHFLKDERYNDEIGIYQGAWYWPEELWRPSKKSVMKDANYLWFNAPSREAIYKRVMKLSEGEDWTYDYEKFVEFDLPIRDANRRARAMAHANGGEEEPVERCRVELRPPTIYKGSWRDAGKKEVLDKPIETDLDKSVKADDGKKVQKRYVLYKGEWIEADKFDKKLLREKKVIVK